MPVMRYQSANINAQLQLLMLMMQEMTAHPHARGDDRTNESRTRPDDARLDCPSSKDVSQVTEQMEASQEKMAAGQEEMKTDIKIRQEEIEKGITTAVQDAFKTRYKGEIGLR